MANRTCSVEDCDRKHFARGMCSLHYERWRQAGGLGIPCSVEGCERPSRSRGFCTMHWQRWQRHGDPLAKRTRKGTGKPIHWRAMARIEPSDGCWLWRGALGVEGYGTISVGGTKGRPVLAHRWSYEHFVGPIPQGLEIDHLCRVRHCVNPRHLEPVTPRENLRRSDLVTGKRSARTHCPQGHPYDEENTRWKQTPTGVNRQCRECQRAYDRRRRALT